MASMQASQKVAQFERLAQEKLQYELQRTLNDREEILTRISQYNELENTIKTMQAAESKRLKSMVNLGSQFYVQAVIPDTSKIFIQIGLGFHVEMTLPEALVHIEKHRKLLVTQADARQKTAAKISSDIKLVYAAIEEMMKIPETKPKQKRSVF